MNRTYIKAIAINKVRHLENIIIPISKDKPKHLILTGKNGSGKTTFLDTISGHLNCIVSDRHEALFAIIEHVRSRLLEQEKSKDYTIKFYDFMNEVNFVFEKAYPDADARLYRMLMYEMALNVWTDGASMDVTSNYELQQKYKEGKLLLAYYRADRELVTEQYKNIEKVDLKKVYSIEDKPGNQMTKYMVNLKARHAFSEEESQDRKEIEKWFDNFENLLKQIFDDNSVQLLFDKATFQFTIHQDGKEDFDFNTLSSGYAAIFEIVSDLIMRMEAETNIRNTFEMEGIVLIDEIETHLHIELQKNILSILTTFFPNLQFIVTTHSPYILNSIENAVVYDLEKRIELENLVGYSAETLSEGYFGEDGYAEVLKEELYRYQDLCKREDVTDEERAERAQIRIKWKNKTYPVGTELYQMFMEIEDNRKHYDLHKENEF